MDFSKNKRARTCKEANGSSCANSGVKKSVRPNRSSCNSDPLAIPRLIERLLEGKYGSVTEEYESVHAEVLHFLSAIRRNFGDCLLEKEGYDAGTCSLPMDGLEHANPPIPCQKQSVSVENGANDNLHKENEAKENAASDNLQKENGASHAPIIVIDSDEDDDTHGPLPLQVWQPDHQDGAHDKQGMPMDFHHRDHVKSSEVAWQPSVIVEKVNLTTSAGNVSPADLVGNDAAAPLLSPFSMVKSKGRGRRKNKVSEDLVKGNDEATPLLSPFSGGKSKVRGRRKSNASEDLVKGNDEATPLLSPFSGGKSKVRGQRKTKAGEDPVEAEGRGNNVTSEGCVEGPSLSRALDYHVSAKSVEVKNAELDSGSAQAILSEKNDGIGGVEDPSDIESPSQSDHEASSNDGLGDLWQDMSLALEFSKTEVSDHPQSSSSEDECDHLFILKDDLGIVCRVCGIIQKSIEKIVDYQLAKGSGTTRTYWNESRNQRDRDEILPSFSGLKSHHDIQVADIAIHPRHEKQMKPHQLEGFCFLVKNLVADNPGGCILAHAPGSGKTFMLISFIQSFLAKYSFARPLVVLPKGILPTWKKEFEKWKVEDIPIYDFYSEKADSRSQQLDILKKWEANRSILFLGYKQFANIICDDATSKVAVACQEHLLKVPSLLIIDEGHTPRNDNTDVLNALSRVQTSRKVVLSGTLFQNHVKEVFNILNLVRPKFLKMEKSRAIVTRIMSRVHISGSKRLRPDMKASFYELVEETLKCDSDLKRKIAIIKDLREMTQNVLHYYKGDFLDELPGMVDFTVMLKLSARQKHIIQKMGKMDKFRRSAICRAIYMHPRLNEISENVTGDRNCDLSVKKIDTMTDNLDVKDGVKAKFFLSILSLSESVGERLLVFSQYLLPLKFLERLVARLKGWRSGKEMFMISGDSSPDEREWATEQFNSSSDARIFFGSIKACGEGISLVGASRVVILDVHLNPSVSRQAIGRAFRPGQINKVYVYRLVAADSPEEEDHYTSFRKELTSKMWFEWSEYSKHDFEMERVEIKDSNDVFFESNSLAEDVQCLYRR